MTVDFTLKQVVLLNERLGSGECFLHTNQTKAALTDAT